MADGTAQRQEGGISVAHASPGRVRLRAAGSDCAPALDAIATQLRQREGVCEISKNQGTGSLTVTFDTRALPLPELLGEIEGWGVTPAAALQAQANRTDPFAAWKSAEFWKKQGRSFLPVIVGLLATRGLGLVGWRALLAYMVAANTTRQLLGQLEGVTPATAPREQIGAPPKPVKIPEQILAATAVREIASSENFSPSLPPPPQGQIGKVGELNGQNSFAGSQAPAIPFSIAHAIRGRVRFHVPRIAADPQYARRLQKLAESAAGVTLVRVSPTAASIAISYDAGAVSDAEMRSHLAALIQEASTPRAPGGTATPPAPEAPEAPEATPEPVESQLALSEAEMETEPAAGEPAESQGDLSEAEMETEPAACDRAEFQLPVSDAELQTEQAPCEPALSAASMETEAENGSPPASEPAVTEEVNFWLCLWQTVRSTMQGLKAGQPPAHALISGLRDAGAIS